MAYLNIGIDALRNDSGGAVNYLINILQHDPRSFGITQLHIWGSSKLLDKLPDVEYLIKHYDKFSDKSLLKQLFWQRYCLPKELLKYKCDLLLATSSGSVARYKKSVVMSRDMLPFEYREYSRYNLLSIARLRLFLLRFIGIRSFKKASGVIFLTNYAKDIIQTYAGHLTCFKIIPHGLADIFKKDCFSEQWKNINDEIRCIYVSNIDHYKHQRNVILAIKLLRNLDYDIKLKLIGHYNPSKISFLQETINECEKNGKYVDLIGHVSNLQLPHYFEEVDIFIFASSCENMPNTLIEGMGSGLPIICSDRGPMPEILLDGGLYFDPENVNSIKESLLKLISNKDLRKSLSIKAKLLSKQYSWERCAEETWKYIATKA